MKDFKNMTKEIEEYKELNIMARKIRETAVLLTEEDFSLGVNGKDNYTRLARKLLSRGIGNINHYKEEIEQLKGQIKRLKEELPKLFRHFTEGDPYFDDYNFEIELQSYQKNDKNEFVTSICLDTEDFEIITKDFIEAVLNGTPSEDLKEVFEI